MCRYRLGRQAEDEFGALDLQVQRAADGVRSAARQLAPRCG
ncbi:hypothetical protein [Streptomyces sp. NPDC097610]